jgi:hypothetical protein
VSYLLFLDESGHDHKNAPYEVRGGVALHDTRLWSFVRAMRELEESCFGGTLNDYGAEIKGHRLLDKDRFKWAAQSYPLNDRTRQRLCRSFLQKGTQKFPVAPTSQEFTAYGQACLKMADGIFSLLGEHEARLFAATIPRGATQPAIPQVSEWLRKDIVFLLEWFFYFLEEAQETGLIVLDQTERDEDRRFLRRLERYFSSTATGQERTSRIVPSPFFVSSEMAYPVQAADVCIYCVNHGFRRPERGMDAPVRQEIAARFGGQIYHLQYKGRISRADQSFDTYGVVYVSDPYQPRTGEP